MQETQSARKIQLWIFQVSIDKKPLFLLLKTKPERGSFWQPITGKAEEGEEFSQAAKREAYEEINLDLEPISLDYEFSFTKNGKEIYEKCFFAEIEPYQTKQIKISSEHVEYFWATENEVKQMLKYESSLKVFEIFLEKIKKNFELKSAPDFTLYDENQKEFTLSKEVIKASHLLVFYPGDFTPVCTKQLCQYRDFISEFEIKKITMVGISPDDSQKHLAFKKQYRLPFRLLSDPDKKVFSLYKVRSKILLGMPSRALFCVNSQMKIIFEKKELTPITYFQAKKLLQRLENV